MSEHMAMRLVASIMLAIAAFCPLAWYIYYRRVVTSRFPGTRLATTRRGIQKQFIVVGGWSTLCFLGWAAFWYILPLIGTANATSSMAWLIVGLLCSIVSIGAQFVTIFVHSKLRRALQTVARSNG